jgi:hypothetical protein
MPAKIAALTAATKRSAKKRGLILAAAGVVVPGVAASPALAATYTLNLSAPPNVVAGQPAIVKAFGIDPPPDEYWNASWIEVVALPASFVSTCPASSQEGASVADGGAGTILAISMRPTQDAAGNFSNQIGFTPWGSGSLLICGYTDDGAGLTLASASITLDVQPADPTPAPGPPAPPPTGNPPVPPPPTANPPAPPPAAPAGAPPANVAKPRVTRSGKALICNPGRWSNHASAYTFGWLVDGQPRRGATGRTLGVTRKLRGHTVRCRVTAFNSTGRGTALSQGLAIR